MIETLMIFALGFLAASLLGLLFLPVLNARAARLARRRAEALLPLAPAEIAAERDVLRARFAVQQRRLERTVEAVRAKRHADMAEIGARAMEVSRLAQELDQRNAAVAEGLSHKARLEAELEAARADGSLGLSTLRALEEAHADLLESLLAARQAAAVQRRDRALATGDQALAAGDQAPAIGDRELAIGDRAPAIGEADAAPQAREPAQRAALAGEPHAADEREDLRRRLAAAEDALAQALSARGSEIERENAELRARITEVADALARRERMPAVGSFAPVASAGH